MSFRTRVFALVLLVSVVAIGSTAWLTLQLVSLQISRAQDAANQHVADIADDVRRYAERHGSWAGISVRVQQLSDANHQRVRLVNLHGQVTVDSDHLAKRAARPVVSAPTLIDPRPTLRLPTGLLAKGRPEEVAESVTRAEIQRYREAMLYSRCLTDRSIEPPIMPADEYGIPFVEDDLDPECRTTATREAKESSVGDQAAIEYCRTAMTQLECYVKAFGDRIATFAPEPLQLFLGAVDNGAARLIGAPILAATGSVLILALAGTALIARYVSRPVRSLTAASRRLADGHLDARVPSVGTDELGQLSTSFNRMAAAIQAAELAQRRLVASVAHELRTPLSNLLGYLEALQDGVVAPSRELFMSLHEEAQLQRRILDDLQDLTLAEAGHLTYRRTDFDLADLIVAGRTAHLAVADAQGVRLAAEAAGPLPVRGDQDRLRQVLGNLLGNAVRYTDAGGDVLLRAYPAGDRVVVEVRDTGCGIAADDLPFVFQRFWRADPARDRATGGSGLGLTIARQIVLDHAGDITVTSEPGVGSVFTFTLPLLR